ncbi:MAG: YeeE/YedE family protein [Pseudomarimonas sp.]
MNTWMTAFAGGALIGSAATLLLWLNGRIAGVSGVLNGLLTPKRSDLTWRILFLGGLIVGGGTYLTLVPAAYVPRSEFPLPDLVLAGLLVGFGTRMGNGCTSGHGVCGLGRLSLRSLYAVLTFMGTAMATTFVVRHVLSSS